ncbi:MAG: hypothetical protein Q9199_004995 [Rusavskia elegans]
MFLDSAVRYEIRRKDSDDAEYDLDVTATAVVSSGTINTPIDTANNQETKIEFNLSIEFFGMIVTNLQFKNNIAATADLLGDQFSLEPSIPIISNVQSIACDFTYLEDIVVPITSPSPETVGGSEGPHKRKARSAPSILRKITAKARRIEMPKLKKQKRTVRLQGHRNSRQRHRKNRRLSENSY